MKITIDTKEDSHEEIKKVISMLSALVGEKSFTNSRDIFSDSSSPTSSSESTNAFANMFGGDSSSNPTTITEIKEEKKKTPEIQILY